MSRKTKQARSTTNNRRHRFDPIAAFGELLIITGLLAGLFAFWDVFVTDWQVASYNQKALTSFQQANKSCPNRISKDERKSAPPSGGIKQENETLGALHVPKWNYMVVPVKEGTTQTILNTGAAGHYETTALPGQIGNFSVAAHRRSFGSNFRRIDVLKPGDTVVMETANEWLIYKVRDHKIVLPTQSDVILPVPEKPGEQPSERLMTMTTCNPEYGNWERYIVHLTFNHWVPRDSGIPKELAEGGNACVG